MDYKVRQAEYFTTMVVDEPGEAYHLLSMLAERGVSLLAFTAVPIGPNHTQLTIFPEESGRLTLEATSAGLTLTGPFSALMVTGSDALGALADIHQKLFDMNVNVYASYGISNGSERYGYLIYVKPDAIKKAIGAFHTE